MSNWNIFLLIVVSLSVGLRQGCKSNSANKTVNNSNVSDTAMQQVREIATQDT